MGFQTSPLKLVPEVFLAIFRRILSEAGSPENFGSSLVNIILLTDKFFTKVERLRLMMRRKPTKPHSIKHLNTIETTEMQTRVGVQRVSKVTQIASAFL